MDGKRKPNSRDDVMSDGWNFGTNYQNCSQSRKVSIGIMIDSVAKCRTQKVKEVEDHVQATTVKTTSKGTSVEDGTPKVKKTSSKGDFMNGRSKKEIPSNSAIRNQSECVEQQASPWISTKTLHHEPTLEAAAPAEKASIVQGVIEMSNRSKRVEVEPSECSTRPFSIQTRTLQFDKSKEVKENGATDRLEKSASKAVLKDMPEKEVKGKNSKSEDAGSETLRLKLRKILGGAISQNKQCANSPFLGQEGKVSHPEHQNNGDRVGEARQNSDTIESDTQSPEYAIKRPTTRSLARKRPPAKLPSHYRKRPPVCKEDHLGKNGSLSKAQGSRKLCDAGTDTPLMDNGRRGKRKSHQIDAAKVCMQNKVKKDEDASDSRKRVPVPKKFVYPGVSDGNGSTLFQKKNGEMVEPNAGNLESFVVEKTGLSNLQQHIDQIGKLADKSKRRPLDSESDKQSPTLAMKTPGRESSPGFAPRSNLGQLRSDGHEQITSKSFAMKKPLDSESSKENPTFGMKTSGRKSSSGFEHTSNLGQSHNDGHEHITSKTEGLCKVKSFDGLKQEYKFNALNESSDDAGKMENSPFRGSRRIMEEDTQIVLSKPSSTESEPEGSEDSSNIQGDMQPPPSPEIGNTPEQQAPQPNKRLFNKGCANVSGVNLAPASSKGIDRKKLERHLVLNEDDPLTSAITLFAISLEKVNSKMKSVTNQRSAEILKSVAEKIHVQLQNAENQIQTDMGKITSLNKSKSAHVEEVLQEKQQHLNAIYERFKEDVNRHLQDCKSTLESLEAHDVKVKATIEKRKASNRKLLLDAEEDIQTQLDDAERRISAVQHVAREKMRQLKMVVAECLKEGVLG